MSYVVLAADLGAYIFAAIGILGLGIVFLLFREYYLTQKIKNKLFKSSKSLKK